MTFFKLALRVITVMPMMFFVACTTSPNSGNTRINNNQANIQPNIVSKGESTNSTPIDSDYVKGEKTWKYWTELNSIFERNLSKDVPQDTSTAEKAIAKNNKTIEIIKNARSQTKELPVSDVDAEVISFTSEVLDNLNRMETTTREVNEVIKDSDKLLTERKSDETTKKALLDYLLGKPGATLDAQDAELREIQKRFAKIQEDGKLNNKEFARLGIQQLKLRSYLSKKYNREFPEIKSIA